MSQQGVLTSGSVIDFETLTGNTGGPVGPDGAGNINVVGDNGIIVSGNPGTNTLTIEPDTGLFPITPYVVGPVGQAGYQTIQDAIDAAEAAGGQQLVYVQSGTYTEDLVFTTGTVALMGAGEQNTFINGTHTPPTSGTLNLWRLTFSDPTAIFSSAAAGTTAIIIEDCTVAVTNGYTFDLVNWTGSIASDDIGPGGTNDGYINNTGGASVFMFAAGVGNGTANSMVLSGFTLITTSNITCPITLQGLQGVSTATFANSTFSQTITTAGGATLVLSSSRVATAATAGISHGSTQPVTISNTEVDSTASPAIAGSGLGTIKLANVVFPSNDTISGSLSVSSAGGFYPPGDLSTAGQVLTSNGTGVAPTFQGPGVGSFPISPYVVGPVGQAGYQTVQAALDAANTAGGGTVYVQPGTYTEDLTLYADVDIWGAVGIADTGTCLIIGQHTPPSTGSFTIRNIFLESATNIFNSAAAGTGSIILIDCAIDVTNGYTFNCPNWTGGFACFDIGEIGSTNDGWVNNTGGATVFMTNITMGAGTANTMIASGFVELYNCAVQCPVDFQTGANGIITGGSYIQANMTFSNNATFEISNCLFSTGANQAITYNSSANSTLSTCTITSSNNPAIGGTGAGTLTIGSVSFTSNAAIAGTVTTSFGVVESGTAHLENISFDQGSTTLSSNGQIWIGSGSGNPAPGTITSSGGTITVTLGANTINVETDGSIAASFPTDSGTATPAAGVLTVAGGTNINTSGAGSTVTVNLDTNIDVGTIDCSQVTVDPGASGDSFVQFDINATGEFRIGVDDTDGDAFKISQGSALGTNDTLVVTPDGEVTRPLQPSMQATTTGASPQTNVTGNGTVYTMQFQTVRFDVGGDYSNPTFTAPVTGKYLITGSATLTSMGSATDFRLNIQTSNKIYQLYVVDPGPIVTGSSAQADGTMYVDMDAGDTATIQVSANGIGSDTADVNVLATANNNFAVALVN